MSIEYLGLSSINGPLIALEGVQGAFFDEIVEFVIGGSERKIGRIIELYEDKAVIQVFEGSENMSLKNTHTRLTGHPMEIALSPDMLGRTFNGIGEPIDDLGPIVSKLKRDVNGLPLKRGDIVAVEASPGHDIGIVSLTGDMVARQMKRVGFNPQNGEFKKIYRKAKPYDIEKWQEACAPLYEKESAEAQDIIAKIQGGNY